ncbi:MAG: hypothetical protein NTX53_17525 [candidate division WOR-3 bacterium]|nr:hypothetical protein [candidate division WOR-3 bacterium]
MTAEDRAKVRRVVVAAIYNVIGAGPAPSDPTEVDQYLKTTIREMLGGSAPPEDRERVAKLVARRTNQYLRKEFSLPANTIIAKPAWLTDNENQPASTYAGKVADAMP